MAVPASSFVRLNQEHSNAGTPRTQKGPRRRSAANPRGVSFRCSKICGNLRHLRMSLSYLCVARKKKTLFPAFCRRPVARLGFLIVIPAHAGIQRPCGVRYHALVPGLDPCVRRGDGRGHKASLLCTICRKNGSPSLNFPDFQGLFVTALHLYSDWERGQCEQESNNSSCRPGAQGAHHCSICLRQ